MSDNRGMVASILLAAVLTSKANIPPLAKVAGIVLGQTTIEQFERAHGKGLVTGGGRTKSGVHRWYDATSGAEISADGSFQSRNGQVIEDVDVDWLGPGKTSLEMQFRMMGESAAKTVKVPVIHLAKNDLGILSTLHPGMTRSEITKAIGHKLNSHDILHARGQLEYPYRLGYVDASWGRRSVRQFYMWTALCLFRDKGLDGLMMGVDSR